MKHEQQAALAQFLRATYSDKVLGKLVRRAETRLSYSPLTLTEVCNRLGITGLADVLADFGMTEEILLEVLTGL